MSRTVTEILNDLNIATADFMTNVVTAINNDNYVSSRLLSKSKPFDGGEKIGVPLKYGRENTQSMSPYDEYNLQPVDILEYAEYEIKHLHGDMVIDKKRLKAQNTGRAALIRLSKVKTENLSETFKNYFSELLFTDVASLESTDPDSLIKICATSNNTVGGINAATETRFSWNPFILDYTSTTPTFDNLIDPTSTYYIEKLFRRILGPLTVGKDRPSLIMVTQGVWDAYETVLRADKRFEDNYTVDGGFEVLKFRGTNIVVDQHVPGGKMNQTTTGTGMMIVLNEKYLDYYNAPAVNFEWTKWKEAERQPIFFSMLDWMGAVTCSRRDRQGAVLGLPTDEDVYGSY